MDDDERFADQVSGIAALADPARRELYLFVSAQPEPVSRDQASAGVGVARHTAKFHLDKLVEAGLLVTGYKRLSGRRGPGAGRPAKVYARSPLEVSVTLPERRYELAGQLMARAIEDSGRDSTPVSDALQAVAAECGRSVGDQVRADLDAEPTAEQVMQVTARTLAARGYEPRRSGDELTLVNCPFDALAREHTRLVCSMNLALLSGVADQLPAGRLRARLDPAEHRCCVVLQAE